MSLRGVELSLNLERSNRKKYSQEVPLHDFLSLILKYYGLKEIVTKSHVLDVGYLSWQKVRKQGVPLLPNNGVVSFGTGFEGYFIGRVGSQEELIEEILLMGKDIWSSIRRLHKHSYKSRSIMEKSIRGEEYNLSAIQEWMAIFGAQLARQRANLLKNPEALKFREQTKDSIAKLPGIDYSLAAGNKIRQVYFLPNQDAPKSMVFSGRTDEEKLALLTMREIGKFGHPLVRKAMTLL